MPFLISLIVCSVQYVASKPQGYGVNANFGHIGVGGFDDSGEGQLLNHGGGYGVNCLPDQILHIDGTCVYPRVTRNIYVYAPPKVPLHYAPAPPIPKPKINYNVVFVKTPDNIHGIDPIVVPPPLQKTIVYVLTKNGQLSQRVIEVPAGHHHSPEVFYVNYNKGDNPVLPGGIYLQEALSSAVSEKGQFLGGVGGPGELGGFGGVGGPGELGGFGGVHGDLDLDSGLEEGFDGDVELIGDGDNVGLEGTLEGDHDSGLIGDGIGDGLGEIGSVTIINGGGALGHLGGGYGGGIITGFNGGLGNGLHNGLGGTFAPHGFRPLFKHKLKYK